jgi:tetratricopeptide (TPR) repeat protein
LFIDRNEGLFNTIAQPELRLKSRPGEMRGQSALQPVLCCLRSRKMTFVFAYLGSFYQPPGWPIHLMYLTEATFVIVTFVCVLFAGHLRKVGTQPQRDMVASTGGISASFGLIMPFELAPFFLGARGETMMASILLILVYPVAAALFIFLFARFMKPDQSPSDLRFDLRGAARCYERGVASLDRKDHDRAIADFTEAIRCNPKHAAAYHNRGAAYLDKKDYDHAIADYDQVIALNPKLAAAYTNRGHAYRAKGLLDRANADFDQAQALMRNAELRLHPERNVDRSGLMGAFAEWRNSRGARP